MQRVSNTKTSLFYHHCPNDNTFLGPPAPSWSLTFDITIAIITDFLRRSSNKTVEDLQALTTSKGLPVPSDMAREKVYVPQDFRIQAGKHLGALLTPEDELNIGWDWRSDYKRSFELRGEWLYAKKNNKQQQQRPKRTIFYIHGGAYYLGSYKIYRQLSSKLAKVCCVYINYVGKLTCIDVCVYNSCPTPAYLPLITALHPNIHSQQLLRTYLQPTCTWLTHLQTLVPCLWTQRISWLQAIRQVVD